MVFFGSWRVSAVKNSGILRVCGADGRCKGRSQGHVELCLGSLKSALLLQEKSERKHLKAFQVSI